MNSHKNISNNISSIDTETSTEPETPLELGTIRHPGEVLLNEFMQPLGLTSARLAFALRITPQRVNEIINGRRGVSPETALRLSKFFDTTPKFWLDLQTGYELHRAQKKWMRTIDHEIPHALAKHTSISSKITATHEMNQKHARLRVPVKLSAGQRKIYNLLSEEPVYFDVLATKSGMSAGDLAATLTILELDGLTKRHFGDRYSKSIVKK